MKKFFIIAFIFLSYMVFSQEIEFIEKLNAQKEASYYDCVKSFCYLYKINVTDDFNTDLESLKGSITKLPKNYSAEKKLTVGTFSIFAIQYLKNKSGLFYLASHSGRYAARELIFRGLLPYNTSEWDILSGEDLIRNIQKVVDYAEEK
jgi:hypothetical protein